MIEYSYSELKKDIREEYEEYIEERNYTPVQSSARVLEESLLIIKEKKIYQIIIYLTLALANLEKELLVDYLHDELKNIEKENLIEKNRNEISNFDELEVDYKKLRDLLQKEDFQVVNFDNNFIMEFNYLLNDYYPE